MHARIIWAMTLFLLVLVLGGCGDGTNPAKTRKAVSALSLATLDQTVGGIQFTLNIPAGVTVQTDAAGVASGVVELTGASGNASLQKSYLSDPLTGNGKLKILVIEPAGFASAEYIMVHLDITGAVPQATDFTIDNLIISDLNGRTISGVNYDYSVEII